MGMDRINSFTSIGQSQAAPREVELTSSRGWATYVDGISDIKALDKPEKAAGKDTPREDVRNVAVKIRTEDGGTQEVFISRNQQKAIQQARAENPEAFPDVLSGRTGLSTFKG